MASKYSIIVDANISEFKKYLDELTVAAKRFPELVQRFVDLWDCLPHVLDIESHTAEGTNKLSIVFKPGKRLLEFLVALRTGDRKVVLSQFKIIDHELLLS